MQSSTVAESPCRVSSTAESAGSRKRPRLLRALGAAEPPLQIEVGDEPFQRTTILKHDSWAATALYESTETGGGGGPRRIICKFNRQQRIFGIPTNWLGHWLARRERRALQILEPLRQVPSWCGPVSVDGVLQKHAVAHVYIEGHTLGPKEHVHDDFFPELTNVLNAIHAAGIVYVDSHKCENIIVDPDGLPHLIDFQVAFLRPRWAWLARATRWLEVALQEMDHYHVRKHFCRNRPDIIGYDWDEFNRRNERPWWIKLHRTVAVPLRAVRRRFLVSIGVRQRRGLANSERHLS